MVRERVVKSIRIAMRMYSILDQADGKATSERVRCTVYLGTPGMRAIEVGIGVVSLHIGGPVIAEYACIIEARVVGISEPSPSG
jgi:hypothetical protein